MDTALGEQTGNARGGRELGASLTYNGGPAYADLVLYQVNNTNGIGIARENQERIFKIFEQVHNPKEYGGTGIGLSIVKRAVENLGGNMGLESQLGEGSLFWIDLKKG